MALTTSQMAMFDPSRMPRLRRAIQIGEVLRGSFAQVVSK